MYCLEATSIQSSFIFIQFTKIIKFSVYNSRVFLAYLSSRISNKFLVIQLCSLIWLLQKPMHPYFFCITPWVYRGNCLKRGTWTVCRFKGGGTLQKRVEWYFWGGGLIPQCTQWVIITTSWRQRKPNKMLLRDKIGFRLTFPSAIWHLLISVLVFLICPLLVNLCQLMLRIYILRLSKNVFGQARYWIFDQYYFWRKNCWVTQNCPEAGS